MKKYMILAAAAIAMAACSNDESNNNVDPNIISLSASIGGVTRANVDATSAQNEQFVADKSIFVEAYKTGQSSTYTTGNYVTGASGTMTGTLYYPSTGENIDICAYYPNTVSSSTTSFAVSATQTTEADYQDYDLMYATKLTDKAKNSTHGLTFHHALSKIVVNISGTNGVTDANINSLVTAVKINGTKLTASTTIDNGTITISGTNGDATDINITGATSKLSQAGIIVPQTVTEGTTFITVTYNSQDYTYAIPAGGKTFAAGNVYTYSLTLSPAGLQLESTQISDWAANDAITPDTIIL